MAKSGGEALGSMGSDTPLAALSNKPRLLFDYFTQLFAQVTNPPLDAIREELVTSLGGSIGPEYNLLDPGPESCKQISLAFPVIDNDELAKIIHVNADDEYPELATYVVRGLFPVSGDGNTLRNRLEEIKREVSKAIVDGAHIIVLSDRDGDAEDCPIPSLLLTATVHHHLIREKTRTQVGLVVEAGDVREVHHVALLIGYGAAAVNPYLVMESAEDLVRQGAISGITPEKAVRNIIKALGTHDFVRVRVKGKFPRLASNQLISEEAVDRAMNDYKAVGYEFYPISVCVDVARKGEDMSTVGVWQGKKGHELRGFPKDGNGKRTVIQTAGYAAEAYRCYKQKYPNAKIRIFVDDDGVGGGVTDVLESWGLPVTGVNSGASAHEKDRFVNLRSEMWWRGGQAVEDGYELPNQPQLKDDLINITYDQTVPAGKIQLEKVRDLKDRGLPSPDYGTNFVLQFAYPQLLDIKDEAARAQMRKGSGSTTMQRRREQGYGQEPRRAGAEHRTRLM
jgi:hypothetical protein